MIMRSNYWSCSKFADWLRGTPKPKALSLTDWHNWHYSSRKAHPFRHWLAEEGLDIIQKTVYWPVDILYDIKYYINNRWVTRTHCLTAAPHLIKRGQWCDVGNRFLPCLFTELVDFVEVELAWACIAWDEEAKKKYNPPFYARGWFRWRTWRSPEAGLEYLKWASELKDGKKLTSQAKASKEILELYNWWKNVYPNREDPYEISGWSEHCANKTNIGADMDPERRDDVFRMLAKIDEIEENHKKEDERMLIRLIKIRDHLWT